MFYICTNVYSILLIFSTRREFKPEQKLTQKILLEICFAFVSNNRNAPKGTNFLAIHAKI